MSENEESDTTSPPAPIEFSESSSGQNELERNQPTATLSRSTQTVSLDSSQCVSSHQDSDSLVSSPETQILSMPFGTRKKSLKILLLHGNLSIWVYEAKDLPNMDMFPKAKDPYVSIALTSAVIGKTYVIKNSDNPVWNQEFNVQVAHYASEVHFLVKDNDSLGTQLLGVVAIPVEQIYTGSKLEGFFPLLNTNGKPFKNGGACLGLAIQYIPVERLSLYHNGVGAGPEYPGIPGTYFPLRKGGNVTLYQDAHVPDSILPNTELDGGMDYVNGTCWIDIFDAINNAQHLVYITGWSVWHKVKLVRETENTPEYELGDLLKTKSQEGVKVLLLVWDDPTSTSIMGYNLVSFF